jgi:hypothetical protein
MDEIQVRRPCLRLVFLADSACHASRQIFSPWVCAAPAVWAVLREQFIVAKLNDAPFKKALSLVDFDEKQSRT